MLAQSLNSMISGKIRILIKKTHTGMGCLELINMKVVQNHKEWRHSTVMQLIETLKIDIDVAIEEVKKIEKFVFQNDFIVEIHNEKQKMALENLIKSMDSKEMNGFSIEPFNSEDIRIALSKQRFDKELKIRGCMPAGSILYTESGMPIELIEATKYQKITQDL